MQVSGSSQTKLMSYSVLVAITITYTLLAQCRGTFHTGNS